MQEIEKIPFTINEIEQELERRECEDSLLEFTVQSFKAEKREFRVNWHHEIICDTLEKVERGELPQVIIIELPPRYTKTELAVKRWVSRSIAKNPRSSFLHLSYSDTLVLDNSSETKSIIQSEWYQDHWPTAIRQDSNAKKSWHTADGGGMHATSILGQMTGFGAGVVGDEFGGAIIIDDPIKPEDADSELKRNKVNNAFHNTIKSRLNNPTKTPIIIIMQRVHENDLAGYIQAGNTEFDFHVLKLPSLNEDGPSDDDPRFFGEALWPWKHDEERLEKMRQVNPQHFAAQYQQNPAPAEGNIIKRSWIKYYDQLPPHFEFKAQSWDMAFKESKKSDFVVGQVWGRNGADHYLIYMYRARTDFPGTLKAFKAVTNMHKVNSKLVEVKANGQAIIDSVKHSISGVIPINVPDSKDARVANAAPFFEAGNVWLPNPELHPWVKIFIEELVTFPNAKHDDTVDSCTQYLGKYGDKGYNPFSSDYNQGDSTISGNAGAY